MDSLAVLERLQEEIDSNGGGAWLEDGIAGANADVTAAQISSAVYDTTDMLLAALRDNGNAHGGNYYRIF